MREGDRAMKRAISDRGLAVAMGLMLLAAVALGMFAPTPVRAATTGSISLSCSFERDGADVAAAGDSFALYRVADARVAAGEMEVRALAPFEGVPVDLAHMSAAQTRRASRDAARIASEQGVAPLAELQTDARGRAAVYDLAPGVYLLVRTRAAAANAGLVADPVLVGVPTAVDGDLVYDVPVAPKFGLDPMPGAPEGGAPEGLFPWIDLPQTGDLQMMLVGILMMLGAGTLWASRRVVE